VPEVALFFVAEVFAIGDQEVEFARVRRVDGRTIDFADNALGKSKPEPAAGVVSSADTVLGRAAPEGLRSRRTRGRDG
jgi:hypothetical protein